MRQTLGDHYSGRSYGNSVKQIRVLRRILRNYYGLTEYGGVHGFYAYFCIVNQTEQQKIKNMKRRILYVGTLVDLALIFEPDEEQESEEVFQSMLNNNNK